MCLAHLFPFLSLSLFHCLCGLQGFLLEQVVVPAAASYGLGDEYAYLRPSIKAFPQGPELVELARQAGFSRASHYEIGFGFMGVLVATR